jgi:hypothetical protein
MTAVGDSNAAWDKKVREWKRDMHLWFGLTPNPDTWTGKAHCPHWLTKKGHRGMRTYCGVWTNHYPQHSLLWDHRRAWIADDGTRVITLEPYGEALSHTDDFLALERDLAEMGVVLAFDHRSAYGAGYTLFLLPGESEMGQEAARLRSLGWWQGTMRSVEPKATLHVIAGGAK